MKKIIKNIFKCPFDKISNVSIGVRLTLSFVFFGMLIGYTTFILYTIGAARSNVEMVYETIVPVVKEITGSKGEDFIADLINKKNDEIIRIYDIINRSSFATLGNVKPTTYYLNRKNNTWNRIYIDNGGTFREMPVTTEFKEQLDEALSRKVQHSSNIFLGQSDRVTLLFGLPLYKAKNAYVMSFEMNREGIVIFIKKNIHRFVLFAFLLLALSVILGKIFAYRITGPIKKLSEVAHDRAAGNLKREFTINRGDEIGVLSRSLDIMSQKIDTHVKEIERRIRTMETMNQIDKAVLSSISRTDLLDRVIGLVSSLIHSRSTSMALYDVGRNGFDLLSRSHGVSDGILTEKPFVPVDHIDRGLMNRVKQVFQFSSLDQDAAFQELFEKLAGHSIGSGINVPVYQSDEYRGSLVLARDGENAFTPEEAESIIMLADQVGIALQSVRHFEEKERLLLGILLALTRSIDAKSKWTAGHSERVATYSEKIAFRMNMPDEDVRTITFSAILHDIGKIAVSELILDKPGKLTGEEYDIIKEHPGTGARIIADIPSYGKILPGILYHHEHWDGSGYPEGLAGDAIPLGSRIITVADVWDAITADRPYRRGFQRQDALDFMNSNCGVLFDASIVGVFMDVLREG
jgi:HD-GYP domain-containing protein (c-di-GMP phosphodiesterase class II)